MLKRIAVVGGAKSVLEAAQRAAGDGTASIAAVAVDAGGAMPQGTVAVLTDSESIEAALPLILGLGEMQERMLNLLGDAIDCREGIPAGSADRLRAHAARFAQAMGMTADQQLTLERGALLHDVGKVRISNEVLLKNSVLTYDDWSLLQQHTVIGAEMLQNLEGFNDVLDIVRYHHECFDGTGYPEGLEGEAIPLTARMIKIIDVYCAMTSPRHYRSTYSSHDEAVHYLQSEQGKHYDPELVAVFLSKNVGQPA